MMVSAAVAALEDLEARVGSGTARALAPTFVRTCREEAAALRRAAALDDGAAASAVAHRLRATMLLLGLRRLARQCTVIDEACRVRFTPSLRRRTLRMATSLDRVGRELGARLSESVSAGWRAPLPAERRAGRAIPSRSPPRRRLTGSGIAARPQFRQTRS